MKKTLLFLFIFISLLIGCEKTDLSNLEDVIFVRRNGADMPAYIYGNGLSKTFVILLHGGPGGSGLQYRSGNMETWLESRYAMVYWDQRGQGMAQGNYSKTQLVLKEYSKDLEALTLVLKEKYGHDIQIFLMGHSWGGMLGTYHLLDGYQNLYQGWIEMAGAHDIPMLYTESIKMFNQFSDSMLDRRIETDFWLKVRDVTQFADTSVFDRNKSLEMNRLGFKADEVLIRSGFMNEYDGSSTTQSAINKNFKDNFLTSFVSGSFTNLKLEDEANRTALTSRLNEITIPTFMAYAELDFVVPPSLGNYSLNHLTSLDSTQKELILYPRAGHSFFEQVETTFYSDCIEFIEEHR